MSCFIAVFALLWRSGTEPVISPRCACVLVCLVLRYVFFLEEISSLSHSVVFLYFFALITEEGFLISPCHSLNFGFKWVYLSLLLCFSLLFSQLFVRPPQKTIFPFRISFCWGWSLYCLLKCQPTPVFLPGKSHGWWNLVGYSPWESQRVGYD